MRVELLLSILDDDALPETGELIELLGHRLVLDEIDEPNGALDVRDDRVGVRVPGEDHLLLPDIDAILHHEHRAERHLQTRAHATSRALVARGPNGDLALVRRDDALSLGVRDDDESLAVLDRSRDLRLPRRLLRDTRRRSADVERAKRELRARLADRLGGNDTDRFAEIDHVHGGQISAVAHAAQSTLRLAGEHRANLDRLDTRLLDRARRVLVDQLASLDEQRATTRLVHLVRILDVLGRHVADDALRQRLDDVLAFLERADLETEDRAAILLADRHVLRHVDETPRQVPGVGRLERRVRQTLSSAVRGDEVLEHRQVLLGSST